MKSNLKTTIDFFNDDILYYAGSLSFFTILALLPILALMIVFVSTLSIFSKQIDQFVLFALDFINPTHSEQLVLTVSGFLSNASDLGTIGLIYLIFSFILFFRDYDHIVNKIYAIEQKSFINMFLVYLVFIFLLPIIFAVYTILVASVNIAFFDNSFFQFLLTFIVNWIFFIFLFKISINKKISLISILISTFIVLISLSTFKELFVFYTLYNQMYASIYGSFSVLMFFFVWLYISWLIYLYGIKLSMVLNQRLSNN
ncbi:MAG: YihY family inner membrane protein [Campylobacteraceae bacterium]|nr:YihY family inner membrane protein [Campylobacteraceae bacterium]MBT3882471.1 YihY family inner membrane protein [Campylobacteraceae bacterium]MBT4030073.1 YihY family inner membrane protein [Campylobacteraceae bacterium]MBT4179077.1 YihY family inner membrane protein [Campylobacteraceae bacterium]MBT4572348.1 YihY family inner membrane protein [Campylobacteraceae bacterium]